MGQVLSVDDLIVNDSFINYCYSKSPEDVVIWENYLLENPGEQITVDEAKLFVLAMRKMLSDPSGIAKPELNVVYMSPEPGRVAPGMRRYWWIPAAAVAAVIAIGAWFFNRNVDVKFIGDSKSNVISNQMLVENTVTKTGNKERKIVYLLDGTKVTMNENTVLTVDSNFGMNMRLVTLEGEAFFDVQHDKRAPFIVQLKDFRIRVLGTMFNVRSYPADKNSETALVKGRVEIEENVSHHKLSLKPYEKAVFPNMAAPNKTTSPAALPKGDDPGLPVVIKPLTISNDGISISETAWMQNRLEINDETFLEIKNKLERWYGVSLKFNDEEVKQYKFTATFEKENIDQALHAMQLSYPFKYSKADNLIMIEK